MLQLNNCILIEDYKIYQLQLMNTCLDLQVVMAQLVPSLYVFSHYQSGHRQSMWPLHRWMQLKLKAILPQRKAKIEIHCWCILSKIMNIVCYLLVGDRLIEDLIKDELMLFYILRKVYFISSVESYNKG